MPLLLACFSYGVRGRNKFKILNLKFGLPHTLVVGVNPFGLVQSLMGETPYSPLGILRQALASPFGRRPRCFTKIQNPKSKIQNPKSKIQNPKLIDYPFPAWLGESSLSLDLRVLISPVLLTPQLNCRHWHFEKRPAKTGYYENMALPD